MQRRLLLAMVFLGAMLGIRDGRANEWSDVKGPDSGPARSIGGTGNGCIAGAAALPFDGPGYQVIRLSRRRYFGHPDTVSFIERLGRQSAAAGLPPFYVGDVGLARGGPMPTGHASHQTGLDVDIWFTLDPKPALAPAMREEVALPSMLLPGRQGIDPKHFDQRQVRLLRLAARDPNVDRIFVNARIKQALCAGVAGAEDGDRSWLRRLRPWYGHDDHFHVRLSCRPGSPDCEPQAPVPEGLGCDSSLDWWFHQPPPATVSVPRAPRVMPAQCRAVLAGKSPWG